MERMKRKKNKNGAYLRIFKRRGSRQSAEEFKSQWTEKKLVVGRKGVKRIKE
jgi:hypothetical protein